MDLLTVDQQKITKEIMSRKKKTRKAKNRTTDDANERPPERGIKYYRRETPDKSFMDELRHTMDVYRDLYNAGLTDSFFDLYNDVIGLIEEYEKKREQRKIKKPICDWPLYK